ncbi:uncharacterized protein LOC114284375 [Camellia sinensis]|uniref:uncharacterized protein LOC114284375 n=1 Tax=Camellia sinensis TaxID=4442 RepID=UPI0010365037|nr:uncharacterized protein LOC114284375 [Camellia sinensis]
MELDADTVNLNSFHYGKVKVATRSVGTINHTINLDCKGVIYLVRICEEQIIVNQIVKEHCICQSFMRNNEDSYSSEEEDETIEDQGSKQEEEEDDVALQMGDEVVKGCDGEAGDRVDAHVNMNDMEEDASLKEVSVVEETEMMEGRSEVGIARETGSVKGHQRRMAHAKRVAIELMMRWSHLGLSKAQVGL